MRNYARVIIFPLTVFLFSISAQSAPFSGKQAFQQRKYQTCVDLFYALKASGKSLDLTQQTIYGVAYAELAFLAEEAFSPSCRLTSDYCDIFIKKGDSGSIAFLQGLSLFGLSDYQGAENAFRLAASRGGKLEENARFWQQISSHQEASHPIDWNENSGKAKIESDIAFCKWILSNGAYKFELNSNSTWWSKHITLLSQRQNRNSEYIEKLAQEELTKPRVIKLGSSSQNIEIHDPYDLYIYKIIFAERARQELEAAIKKQTDDYQTQSLKYFLGRVCYLLNDFERARELLITIENEKIKYKAMASLGAVYFAQGDTVKAKEFWNQCLQSSDQNALACAAYYLYVSNVNPIKAKQTLETICKSYNANQLCFMNLAKIYINEKDYKTARKYIFQGYNTRNREVSQYNRPDYLLYYAEAIYLCGSLGFPIVTETLCFLQEEFPFLKGLHYAMQGIYADNLKRPAGTGDVRE